MTKKGRNILITIGLICILGYTGFWVQYYLSMKKANKKGMEIQCGELMEKEFEGQLVEINRFRI